MRRIVFALSVMVLVLSVSVSAQTQTASVEQELVKLERSWAQAMMKKDIAFLDQILADDIVETDSEGNVFTKTQDLAEIKSSANVITSWAQDDIQVRVYGDMVVVTGRTKIKGQDKGKEFSAQYRWTDTFIKRDGRWQCVATHSSRIAQEPAFTLSEEIGTGKVLGIHSLSLKDGVDPREFEKFMVEEWAPVVQDIFPGIKIMVMKGERGSKINQYILAFDISSLYVRNFYIPRPWENSEVAQKIIQDCHDKWMKVWDRFGQMAETSEYTDYVALVRK